MTSVVGDVYDHATDLIGWMLLVAVVWDRQRDRIGAPVLAAVGALVALMTVHFGCQQRWLARRAGPNDDVPETLDAAQPLCPELRWAAWTRYFGPGTLQTFTLVYVLLLFLTAAGGGRKSHGPRCDGR